MKFDFGIFNLVEGYNMFLDLRVPTGFISEMIKVDYINRKENVLDT